MPPEALGSERGAGFVGGAALSSGDAARDANGDAAEPPRAARGVTIVVAAALALAVGGLVALLVYRAAARKAATPTLYRTLPLPADVRLDVPVTPALALGRIRRKIP